MAKIRVLRILEYTYDTPEKMVQDMNRWTHTINVAGMVMTTTHMDPQIHEDLETEESEYG